MFQDDQINGSLNAIQCPPAFNFIRCAFVLDCITYVLPAKKPFHKYSSTHSELRVGAFAESLHE